MCSLITFSPSKKKKKIKEKRKKQRVAKGFFLGIPVQILLQKLLQLVSLNQFKKKFYLGKMVFEHILRRVESDATRMILVLAQGYL